MRKIVITLVVLACAYGVKAQQAQGMLKQQLLKTDSLGANRLKKINIIGNRNVDNMPIAVMPGKSNMPVVQTDRTAYTMPVAGINQPQVYTMAKPGANTIATPWLGGKAPLYYEFKKYPNDSTRTDNKKQ